MNGITRLDQRQVSHLCTTLEQHVGALPAAGLRSLGLRGCVKTTLLYLGLSSFLCKWCGLQVGVDAFGVGQGELLEGLFPVGGHGSLDESPRGSSLVGW